MRVRLKIIQISNLENMHDSYLPTFVMRALGIILKQMHLYLLVDACVSERYANPPNQGAAGKKNAKKNPRQNHQRGGLALLSQREIDALFEL